MDISAVEKHDICTKKHDLLQVTGTFFFLIFLVKIRLHTLNNLPGLPDSTLKVYVEWLKLHLPEAGL
jgi:hypothetical protein